jgi:hypothetical protein
MVIHMMEYVRAAVVVAIATIWPGVASATVFDFSFTANNGRVSGLGTFTTSDSNSPYLITGATGTITDGQNIASIFTTYTITGVGNSSGSFFLGVTDNLLYLPATMSVNGPTFFDRNGIGITTSGPGYKIYNTGLGGSDIATSAAAVGASLSLTITPEVVAAPGPVAGAGLIPLLGFAAASFARGRERNLTA